MPKQIINVKINGEQHEVAVEPNWTLLATVREALSFTGPKEGCGTGDCGACSMIVDGRLITSCLMLGTSIGCSPRAARVVSPPILWATMSTGTIFPLVRVRRTCCTSRRYSKSLSPLYSRRFLPYVTPHDVPIGHVEVSEHTDPSSQR